VHAKIVVMGDHLDSAEIETELDDQGRNPFSIRRLEGEDLDRYQTFALSTPPGRRVLEGIYHLTVSRKRPAHQIVVPLVVRAERSR
jgi:hypothetical protein